MFEGFSLAEQIHKLYYNLTIKQTTNQSFEVDIIELKRLMNMENSLYNSLSYEETKHLFDTFSDEKFIYNNQDVLYRVNLKLENTLNHKFYDRYNNFMKNEEDKEIVKKYISLKSILSRDISFMCFYLFSKYKEDVRVKNMFNVSDEDIAYSTFLHINMMSYFYPEVENEIANNNFCLDNYNLINNLAFEMSQISEVMFTTLRNCFIEDELSKFMSDYCHFNYALKDKKSFSLALIISSRICAACLIDSKYLEVVLKLLDENKNINNALLYNFIKINLNDIKEDKNKLKYLTLSPKDKYL